VRTQKLLTVIVLSLGLGISHNALSSEVVNEFQVTVNNSQDRVLISNAFYLNPKAKKKMFWWFGISDAGRFSIDLGADTKKGELRTVGLSISRLYDLFGRSGVYFFDRESAYYRYQKYDKSNPSGYLFEAGVGYEFNKSFSQEFSVGYGENNDGTKGTQFKIGFNFRW